MSAKQTGLIWELDLPHNEAWVLMAMADHADHEGHNVYPGVPLLAWKTGYTIRQVRRILSILQGKGLIVVEEEGGGRRTTRYRLELFRAERKDPHRPGYARPRRNGSFSPSESREVKMSPPIPDPSETPMSPQGGQDVRAARTQPCHPNRHGREGMEPSEPPPSKPPLPAGAATVTNPAPNNRNCEGGSGSGQIGRGAGEVNGAGDSREAIRAACAAWPDREALLPERRDLFERQAERLASGEDAEAWTHPQNGTVVPPEDRPRVFALGLHHLGDGTSQTLRGGVMYAVAKHYRIPPPLHGTEYAGVESRGAPGEDPGRTRARTGPVATPTPVAVLLGGPGAAHPSEEDSVERWEREFPEECIKLRDRITRQLAAEVGGRQVSEQTLRTMGLAQYRHLVLQRVRAQMEGCPQLSESG